jgi:hypothetical protein
MDIGERGCGFMDSLELVQDRGKWRAVVCKVMNLQFS